MRINRNNYKNSPINIKLDKTEITTPKEGYLFTF